MPFKNRPIQRETINLEWGLFYEIFDHELSRHSANITP